MSTKINALIAMLLIPIIILAGCGPASQPTSTTPSPLPSASVAENVPNDENVEDKPEFYEMTTSFESNDGFITNVEVIQVMARGLDTDTGELYDMNRYVAGKNTIIRGVFGSEVEIEQDGSVYLDIKKNGEEVAQLLPLNNGASQYAFFAPRNISDVNNWEPGAYSFDLVYNESTGTRTVSFNEARKIRVLAVPVLANYGGNVVACEGEWQTAITFTRDTFPLATDGIDYVLGNELDLSDNKYDLTTDEGCFNVWEALSKLQTPNNDYELILGFVRNRQGAEGTTQGYTYGKPANIITESDGDMQPTVAHEIAHCYLVGDEYPGGTINNAVNAPPYGMEGSDWNDRGTMTVGMKKAVVSANDAGNPNTGSLIADDQVPMNVNQGVMLSNIGSFMGSGSDYLEHYWITSDIWNQLHKAYVPGSGDMGMPEDAEQSGAGSGGGVSCTSCFATVKFSEIEPYGQCESCDGFTAFDINNIPEQFVCEECQTENTLTENNVFILCPSCDELFKFNPAEKAAAQKTAVTQKSAEPALVQAIDISGIIYEDGRFNPSPWFTYETDSSNIDKAVKGSYSVIMEDSSGKKLSQQYLNISFYTQSNPPKKNNYTPINATLKYHQNASVIKIMQGDKAIYAQSVTAGKPMVSFVDVAMEYKGKATVSWKGSDSDNDKLYYELWYCSSDEDYHNIASNITETSYTVDFDKLPGSKEGYFYIFASDGVNTVESPSDYFSVQYKAPEIITKQDKVPEFKLTDEIKLDADIYDMQDGWLFEDEQAEWTYKGKTYTTGSLLWIYPYELAPGEHTFTLTAKNSRGVSATQDFKFKVLDDESALPGDWSKQDVKSALSNGFIAPLANINSAITRGQFAKLMANLYWTVWEEGAPEPDYEENVVKDCGTDDYDQFLMVKLGVMDAPSGKFNPNGNLTQEEAAVIIYKICSIADPNVAEPIENKDQMVEICVNSGVMETSGDNLYAASDKITGRLALVRCNRTYEAIFGD